LISSCLPGSFTPTNSKEQNASPAASSSATNGTKVLPSQGFPGITSTQSPQFTPTQAPIPEGWKLSKDASGTCQVATPTEWQLGSDFFLAVENADPGPFEEAPGQFPPMGLALWGGDESTPLPEGKHFQLRTSLVIGDQVCSVWRIKAEADFTDAEKSEMEQVGATLQEGADE
jgi:hypothetical protein